MSSPAAEKHRPVVVADSGALESLAAEFGDTVHLMSIGDWMRDHSDLAQQIRTKGELAGDIGHASVIGAVLTERAGADEARSLFGELRIPVLEADGAIDRRQWLAAILADELNRSRTV